MNQEHKPTNAPSLVSDMPEGLLHNPEEQYLHPDHAVLYVVATPIGNLGDITIRALKILNSVDLIAAEDTRVSKRLLQRYRMTTPLMAVHQHNERHAAQRIVEMLGDGKRIALVSDAGSPGIADPGAQVVQIVRAAGHAIVPIPGASALATAISVSGLSESGFLFHGFLPARSAERQRALKQLVLQTIPTVFYEAPHRIQECMHDLVAVFGGDRTIMIARELTKVHETLKCCTLSQAIDWLEADDNQLRGEFVLVLAGNAVETVSDSSEMDSVLVPLLSELPLKQAVALAVKISGSPRNALYQRALELQDKTD